MMINYNRCSINLIWGKLISSKKTAHGAMGQTMFVSSTEGEYVFKGNPLYDGQLVEDLQIPFLI